MEADSGRRQFKILRCLGKGGFGEVYAAQMVSTGGVASEVAVKVLHAEVPQDGEEVRRLREEARVLGLLNHPNILTFFDLVVLNGRVALITQFVDGADFDECFRATPAPSPRALVEVIGRVADALENAWSTVAPDGEALRLVHRDIKPSNVRVGRHGDVKLLDFGIAKARDRQIKTSTGLLVGSLPYIAPERFDAEVADSPTGDVYALGCTLFEALVRERLFEGVDESRRIGLAVRPDKHDAWLEKRWPLLAEVPEPVRDLVRDMTRYEASERPTAAEVSQRCDDLADEIGGASLARWCKQHTWTARSTVPGTLDGLVISEATLSKYNLPGVAARAATQPDTRPVLAPTGVFAPPPAPEPVAVKPAARKPTPAPAAEPPRPPEPAPRAASPSPRPAEPAPVAPPPSSGGGGRTLAVVGVALAGVVGVVALIAVLGGAGALAVVSGRGEASDPVAGPEAVATVHPPDGPTPNPAAVAEEPLPIAEEPSAAPAVAPPATASVARAASGAETPPVVEAAVAEAPPVPAASCDDHKALELDAMGGKLAPDVRACLVAAAKDTTRKQTERDRISRIVLANDQAICTATGKCADYEAAQRYHLAEIDRSDPDMLYAWTVHLSEHEGSKADVILWAERTLAERDRWKVSRDLPNRIDKLYQMRAQAAYDAWNAAPSDERARVKAVNAAVDWMEYRGAAGRDPAPAKALCASAHGSDGGKCARVGDAEVAKIRFASVPMGLEVWVDGKQVGVTPVEVEIVHGAHELEMRNGEERQSRRIQVGSSQPTRYTWTGGTAWDDGY